MTRFSARNAYILMVSQMRALIRNRASILVGCDAKLSNHKTGTGHLMSKNEQTSTIMAPSGNPLIWSSKLVYEGEFSSAIRGHHVYKATWSLTKTQIPSHQ